MMPVFVERYVDDAWEQSTIKQLEPGDVIHLLTVDHRVVQDMEGYDTFEVIDGYSYNAELGKSSLGIQPYEC